MACGLRLFVPSLLAANATLLLAMLVTTHSLYLAGRQLWHGTARLRRALGAGCG